MTGSVYGFGWPSVNPLQQQILQLLHSVPQQLQHLQQLTSLQQQQLQQIQQLLVLVPQQFQQAVQQIAYVVSHQLQQFPQHATALQSPGVGSSFHTLPFGQQIFPGQPGQVM
jgi:hypothetical protein